ncbi:unnamed protein product [Rhizophagus irregularis]|nr:unnamed protein product [Rhizophagus irregularis]
MGINTPTKRRKTNNVLPNSANLSLPIEESENNLTLIIKVAVAKDPAPRSHLALAASKNPVKNSVKNSNNKLNTPILILVTGDQTVSELSDVTASLWKTNDALG